MEGACELTSSSEAKVGHLQCEGEVPTLFRPSTMCRTDQDLFGKLIPSPSTISIPTSSPLIATSLFSSRIGQDFTGDHILLVRIAHVYRPPPLCSSLKTRQETAIGDEVRGNPAFSQRSKKLQSENPNFTSAAEKDVLK